MTHIQLEIQTSVPTKRSLVIMIKPGHLSNVTLEAVHQQDHHRQSVGPRRRLCLVFKVSPYLFVFNGKVLNNVERNILVQLPGGTWQYLVSGIWYLVVSDPGHLVRSPAASIVSTSLPPILASFNLGHCGYHRYSIKGTVACALVSAIAYREARALI